MYVCMYVCMYLPIDAYFFCRCYEPFGACPNVRTFRKICKWSNVTYSQKSNCTARDWCQGSRVQCRTAGYKSVCIRKVLWPANSIRVFRGFLWSQGKYWVATQIPHCSALYASHGALSMVTSTLLSSCSLLNLESNLTSTKSFDGTKLKRN
jgi:hypothetical protein